MLQASWCLLERPGNLAQHQVVRLEKILQYNAQERRGSVQGQGQWRRPGFLDDGPAPARSPDAAGDCCGADCDCRKPLHFEQWNLERYGYSFGCRPYFFLSGARFFVTLPVLPYRMGVDLPRECLDPLGSYRPGNCAP